MTETMTEARDHLLMKRGLYYRPANCGYTAIKDHAGRYPASEARSEDGVTAIHEDEAPAYLKAGYSNWLAEHASAKVKEQDATIRALQAALTAATSALKECASRGHAALAKIDALAGGNQAP
jgi:hypothetical protein